MQTIRMSIFLSLLAMSAPAAAQFDGSQPLLCAATEATECAAGIECLSGSAESINLPEFFRINFDKKEITSTRADGSKRSTSIETVSPGETAIILRGAQGNLGWSMNISNEGRMSLAVAGERVGYVVFGMCTLP
jgi:hypothetical protein